MSSLVPYEGLDTLVEAVALLCSGGADVGLHVVGDGVALASLQRRAVDLGVDVISSFPSRVVRKRTRATRLCLAGFTPVRRNDRV